MAELLVQFAVFKGDTPLSTLVQVDGEYRAEQLAAWLHHAQNAGHFVDAHQTVWVSSYIVSVRNALSDNSI